MFRRLEKLPHFDLLSVGLGPYSHDGDVSPDIYSFNSHATPPRELWRRYKLAVPSFDCDIVEVFPDRRMFTHGEAWLDGHAVPDTPAPDLRVASKELELEISTPIRRFMKSSNTFLLPLAAILMLAYELTFFLGGGRNRC